MAIKNLFSKQKSQSVKLRGANKKSLDEFKQEIESGEEINQIRIEDSLITPDLDYATASNFVKYGSAKKYYEDSIKRIYSQYPYDGSNSTQDQPALQCSHQMAGELKLEP
jgi:long-subunit acyl-CoA synthetase (AMP-forming)